MSIIHFPLLSWIQNYGLQNIKFKLLNLSLIPSWSLGAIFIIFFSTDVSSYLLSLALSWWKYEALSEILTCQ